MLRPQLRLQPAAAELSLTAGQLPARSHPHTDGKPARHRESSTRWIIDKGLVMCLVFPPKKFMAICVSFKFFKFKIFENLNI